MAIGGRIPSSVFRSPINALSQGNIMASGTFQSQRQLYNDTIFQSQQQLHDDTTYVDDSTIVGGTYIELSTNEGTEPKTSEVD